MEIRITQSQSSAEMLFEFVERKGLGHPDSICDAVMDAAAEALQHAYRERCGRVLHYNLDKALLVAGRSRIQMGGGRVLKPMQLFCGDRATRQYGSIPIPVDEIVEAAVRGWFRGNLRYVDATRHLIFHSEIQPGSTELTDIFHREQAICNDTSAAVGYAPLSETERLVLALEGFLTSPGFQQRFPAVGEDIKVMAVRDGVTLRFTVAMAFVDRFIAAESEYFDQKMAIRDELIRFLQGRVEQLQEISVAINTLDRRKCGEQGMYLTVVGTSAESGDSGQVGRGNAVNGIISLTRPTSNEAAAGKNNVCHVGRIYNYVAHDIAHRIVCSVEPVREANVWLCSQIGRLVTEPWLAAVSVNLDREIGLSEVQSEIESIVAAEVSRIGCLP